MTRREIDILDGLWAEAVKLGKKCEHCGISGCRLEAAHVVGRRHRITRWGTFLAPEMRYDLCGHCFCHNCHQQYDEHGPLEEAIINDTIGRDRKLMIQTLAKQQVGKYQEFDYIKNLLERYKEGYYASWVKGREGLYSLS